MTKQSYEHLDAFSSADSLLTLLLGTTQDGILIVAPSGRIERYNPRFAQLWGLPEWSPEGEGEQAVFETIAAQIDPAEAWIDQLRNRHPNRTDERLVTLRLLDGRVFEVRSGALSGEPPFRIWSFRDATSSFEAERALRESQQLLSVHFSRTPLASIAWDPEFCVVQWNPAAEKIFGYTAEEAMGRSGLDLIVPPALRDHVTGIFHRLLHTESSNVSVNENVTRSGDIILCEWHNTRLVGGDGTVLAIASFAQNVTERHQAQEALRVSEERYRELCNSLPQTIFELDTAGTVTFANESAVQMFGYSHEEIARGFRAFDILVPEDRLRAREVFRRALIGEAILGAEYTAIRKDGTRVPIMINGSPILRDGRTVGTRGVVTDLSPQKRIATALEARLSFERLVANLSANFINLPADRIEAELGRALRTVGRWLDADRSYIFMLDAARSRLTLVHEFLSPGARSIADLTLPIPSSRFAALLERLAQGPPLLLNSMEDLDPSWVQERQFLSDLRVRSTALVPLIIGASIHGFAGFDLVHRSESWSEEMALQLRLLGEVFASALDRKRAEEALISSETKYRNLMESSGLAVSFIDAEGRYLIVNQTAASYIGRPPDQIVGRHLNEVYMGERAEDYLDRFQAVLKTGTSQTSEDRLQLADGPHWFWTIIHPVYEPGGRLLGVQVVSHDITERKDAETELGQLEEQLLHAQKMEAIGNLAGGIAHDFNNLLTGVMGYANVLRLRAHSPEEVREAAGVIEKTAERASQLTRQLLGFARKGKLQEVPVDVHAIIEDVITLLSRTIDKSIQIEKQLKAKSSMVRGDPTQLQQVVLNLAVNARDAMPRGGTLTFHTGNVDFLPESSWRLAGAQTGAHLIFSVSDTGIGIPPEIRDRVFEPFFTTKTTGMGTGMGLATVYGIVKNHGGLIRLVSEIGVGSTFKVFLPILSQVPEPELAPVRQEIAIRGEGRVLVVDDEGVVRDLAETMLSELGYEVVTVTNGREAVDAYCRTPGGFDLVLLDMIMPVMGGKECFRELRRIDPEVVAVLSTGFGSDAEVQEVMKEGIAGFIQKPYRINELSRVVKAALERAADETSA